MCGRFALYSPHPKLSESLQLTLEPRELETRYNVAPGTWITSVRHPDDEAPLLMDEVWWGYRPLWAGGKAPQPINATDKKVVNPRYLKKALVTYHCFVVSDG